MDNSKPQAHRNSGLAGMVWRCALLAALAAGAYMLARSPSLERLPEVIASADLRWLCLVVLLQATATMLRSKRLELILHSAESFWRTFHLTTMGLMVNSLLPMRAGEVCMALLLRPKLPGRGAEAIARLLLDRLMDFLAVCALCLAALLILPGGGATEGVAGAALTAGIALVAAMAGLAAIIVFGPWFSERICALPGRLGRMLAPCAATLRTGLEGLRSLMRAGILMQVSALSLLLWTVVALSFAASLKALGLSPGAPCIVLTMFASVMGRLAAPSPAGVGSVHGGMVLALTLFDQPLEQAIAFSLVHHAVITGVHLLMGIVGIRQLQIDFSSLKRMARTGGVTAE